MTISCSPTVRAASATDRGRVRPDNQDAYYAAPDGGLFIIADGMGGRHGGSTAAQLVVTAAPGLIADELARSTEVSSTHGVHDSICGALRRAIQTLNGCVLRTAEEEPSLRGMGATLVLALLVDRYAYVAHVGDSRAYLAREGKLRQLTADHNLAELLVELRQITVDQAPRHPGRNQLTRYVGVDGDPAPDLQTVALCPGDRLLLCSDGLSGMVPNPELEQLVRYGADPNEACCALIRTANQAGGRDNISVIVVEVDAIPDSTL